MARVLPTLPCLNQQATKTNVRNRLVNFRIIDVYHPDPNDLLRLLHGEDLLQGVVIDMSQGVSPEASFVVVQVDEVPSPVVVPLDRVEEAL